MHDAVETLTNEQTYEIWRQLARLSRAAYVIVPFFQDVGYLDNEITLVSQVRTPPYLGRAEEVIIVYIC
jgi:hypothetical protein